MKKFIIKKIVPKAVDTWEVEAENQGEADFAIYNRHDNAILKNQETFDADYKDADFTIFEENEKTQEVLASFTSEELLYEVHKRRNIYIEGWYNADHINNNTDLPMQYCGVFIKWACDTACDEDLEDAVEQWIDIMKDDELKKAIEDNFAPAGWGDTPYNIQFEDLCIVEYDCDIGFYAELKDEFFNDDQSELRTDMLDYYEPHQGNIKTYLEERMNEVINEYLSF